MIAKKKTGKRISVEVIGREGLNPTYAGKRVSFCERSVRLRAQPHIRGKNAS